MEIAALVCVRDVLVQTASVDPTVNAPRKALIAASQSELNYNQTTLTISKRNCLLSQFTMCVLFQFNDDIIIIEGTVSYFNS